MPPAAPRVGCEMHHPTLPVADVTAAANFYTKKLGFVLDFLWGDPPTVAGLNLGRVSIHLIRGTPNPTGCSVYFVIDDADRFHEFHQASGVEVVDALADRPWGLREYAVRDLHGYELRFGHHLPETGPPIRIERVDVPVRLEKRLAALLHDLAAHKRMSLDSCLEETLLHTFERLGEGVASPHTSRTLEYIAELRQKHGIDYDCHGSYRFVE